MSYDIRFAVKAENGQLVDFMYPDYCDPTYNLGNMFRACMGWDYEQGKYYKVSEIKEYITKGIAELSFNRNKYLKYNPPNGWGTLDGALEVLKSIFDCIVNIQDWYNLPLDYVYMAW